MQKFNPSGRAIYLSLCLALVLVSVLTTVLMGIMGNDAPPFWILFAIYGAVFLVGVAVTAASTRLTAYEISDDEVLVRHGILSREEKIIPFDKIDNISMKRTLRDTLLGLANVYIDTPASPEYEIIMRNLPLGDAKAVVETLRESAVKRQEREERPLGQTGQKGKAE